MPATKKAGRLRNNIGSHQWTGPDTLGRRDRTLKVKGFYMDRTRKRTTKHLKTLVSGVATSVQLKNKWFEIKIRVPRKHLTERIVGRNGSDLKRLGIKLGRFLNWAYPRLVTAPVGGPAQSSTLRLAKVKRGTADLFLEVCGSSYQSHPRAAKSRYQVPGLSEQAPANSEQDGQKQVRPTGYLT